MARCHRIGQELPVVVFKYEMDELSRDQLHQLRLGSLQLLTQSHIDGNKNEDGYGDPKRNLEDDDCKRNCSMDQYVNSVQNKKKGLIAEMFA